MVHSDVLYFWATAVSPKRRGARGRLPTYPSRSTGLTPGYKDKQPCRSSLKYLTKFILACFETTQESRTVYCLCVHECRQQIAEDRPAKMAACRAGFWPNDVWTTFPIYTSVTSSFSIPSKSKQSRHFEPVIDLALKCLVCILVIDYNMGE